MFVKALRNQGNGGICSGGCVCNGGVSFALTEQLPCLGGLYHQGRETAVPTQVSMLWLYNKWYVLKPHKKAHLKVALKLVTFQS